MKKSISKGDKKAKKAITAEIALLENETARRQEQELLTCETAANAQQETPAPITTSPVDDTIGKPSRAQKRREKKENDQKRHHQTIKDAEKEALSSDRTIETKAIEKQLAELNLKCEEVPADGDCLYNAISQQLSRCNAKTCMTVDELRQMASEHMKNHIDDFLPFMMTENDEVLTPARYEEHCRKVASTKLWGGQMEIRAISESLKHKIVIHQANLPHIVTGEQYNNDVLQLSYHQHQYGLGAHYNAVVPKDG